MSFQQTARSETSPTSLWEGHTYAHMRTGGAGSISSAGESKEWDEFLSWELDRDLLRFVTRTLFDLELPMVVDAFALVGRGAWREFLSLDTRLGHETKSDAFREASRRIGTHRLELLAPLKDHRMLSRYRTAVVSGKAVGWHPLVYALFLDAYSIPLREGLSHYGLQAVSCLVERLHSRNGESRGKLGTFENELREKLKLAIESAVGRSFGGGLKIV